MPKFKKKPVIIEAVKWTGGNKEEIMDFSNDSECIIFSEGELMIDTLEGRHYAERGDYIIKGVEGEFYPCKSRIFHKTYDTA